MGVYTFLKIPKNLGILKIVNSSLAVLKQSAFSYPTIFGDFTEKHDFYVLYNLGFQNLIKILPVFIFPLLLNRNWDFK